MHQNDADPEPSVPHGHAKGKPYKLNVWNGEVFHERTDKKVGRADKKEIKALHKNEAFLNFAREAIRVHQTLYPTHHFYIPEWLEVEETNKLYHCTNEQEFSMQLTVIIKR